MQAIGSAHTAATPAPCAPHSNSAGTIHKDTSADWEMRLKVLASTAVPPDVSNPMAHLVFDNSIHGVRFDLTAETGGRMHARKCIIPCAHVLTHLHAWTCVRLHGACLPPSSACQSAQVRANHLKHITACPVLNIINCHQSPSCT